MQVYLAEGWARLTLQKKTGAAHLGSCRHRINVLPLPGVLST
jgi:hypothetical protein